MGLHGKLHGVTWEVTRGYTELHGKLHEVTWEVTQGYMGSYTGLHGRLHESYRAGPENSVHRNSGFEIFL